MKRFALVLVVAVVISSVTAAIILFGLFFPEAPDVEGAAVVRFSDLESGCWYLEGEDGQVYLPTNLPEQYRQEGLRVHFSARIVENGDTYCFSGTVVEILGISEVS